MDYYRGYVLTKILAKILALAQNKRLQKKRQEGKK